MTGAIGVYRISYSTPCCLEYNFDLMRGKALSQTGELRTFRVFGSSRIGVKGRQSSQTAIPDQIRNPILPNPLAIMDSG